MKKTVILVLSLLLFAGIAYAMETREVIVPDAIDGEPLADLYDIPVAGLNLTEGTCWWTVGTVEEMIPVALGENEKIARSGTQYLAELTGTGFEPSDTILINEETITLSPNRERALAMLSGKGGGSAYFEGEKIHLFYTTYAAYPEVYPPDIGLAYVGLHFPEDPETVPGNIHVGEGKDWYCKRNLSEWYTLDGEEKISLQKGDPTPDIYYYKGVFQKKYGAPFESEDVIDVNGIQVHPESGEPDPSKDVHGILGGDGTVTVIVKFPIQGTPNNPSDEGKIKFRIGEKTYTVDGTEKGMDTAPYIKEDRTMLPVRFVGEALGLTVDYIPETRTAHLYGDGKDIKIDLRNGTMKVNGRDFPLETGPDLIDDRTFLPVAVLGEALGMTRENPESGYDISWYGYSKTVIITR